MNNLAKSVIILLFFSHITLGSTIWNGKIGNLDISWTTEDIIAVKTGKVIFSAKELAKQDFEADFMADNSLKNIKCDYEREFIILSIVGRIASFQETEYVNCDSTPHPTIMIKYVARDLVSGNKIKLNNLFSEADLVTALKNDSLIKTALSKTNPQKSVARISGIVNNLHITKIDNLNQLMLNGLYKALEWSEITVKGCNYRLDKDFLTQFAFHHLNKGQVAVRLNLLPNTSACQTKDIQLGLYLPIPNRLKIELEQANKGKAGFLMAKSINTATKIAFTTSNTKSNKITQSTASKTIPNKSANNYEKILFTVRSGHTLYGIAKHFDRTVSDIINWNNLQPPYKIFAGQKLTILIDKLSQYKIITASGINVRSSPKLGNNIVGRLQFGMKVKQLARIDKLVEIGRFRNYWYKIETANGKKGWIFGRYLSDFIPMGAEKKAKFYFQIAKQRLKKRLNLPNQINLIDFLDTIKNDMLASPKRAEKLAMLHLRSLTKLIVMSKGNFIDKSLDKVIKFIQSTRQSQILDNNRYLSKEINKLRIAVDNTGHLKKDTVIKQIDEWLQLIK
ncbi:MAG TPA: LysM peptidoglycan-binding domain-containing protein [Thioploca sp.]|nr:LysM peptidoglycan-binding domain-containing protein [Thioploca sp.]